MKNWFELVKADIPASIVVFLVALPLCMGIAIASNVPPALGLITGIVGGLVVGVLAGAPMQVSGPAAGLSVMIYQIVQEQGIEALGIVVLIAGLAQAISGALKLGQWFRAVSPAVIRGMLAGIGVLIFASQFHVMVDDSPKGNGIENILSIPMAVWKGVMPSDDTVHHHAAIIGLVTMVVLVLWKPLVPKQLKMVPASLVAVLAGTIGAAVVGFDIKMVNIPDNLFEAVRWPWTVDLKLLEDGGILLSGLAVAFVASAETLLCVTATDQMHSGPRAKYDRELFAQGIGNSICGFLGALPMTGVIVRSAANIEGGAKTRASAILHGVWLVLFVAALPFVLRMIPTASLAAVLVYTGYRLVDWKSIRMLAGFGRGELVIYFVTVGLIVATDLLTGVLVGIGLSTLKLLATFSFVEIEVRDDPKSNRTDMFLRGAATFVRLPRLALELERVHSNAELHVHLDELTYIDHACLDLLMNWEKQHVSTGGRLVIDWESLTAKFRNATNGNGGRKPAAEGA